MSLAILFFPVYGFAASLSGVVLDPQDLTVRGARVELTCAIQRTVVVTDAEGRFTIAAPSEDDCVLLVTQKGFAPYQQRLSDTGSLVTVRLQVGSIEQHVNVEARAAPTRLPLGSVSLSADERDLRTLAGSTTDLIRYARILSGSSTRTAVIYVDGLPGGVLPPLDAIAQISINADPFSAEHANGDATSIEIITKSPARRMRFFTSGDVPVIAGRDVLSPASRSTSRFANLGVQGPVPHVPLTFAASAALGRSSQEMPVHAVLPEFAPDGKGADSVNSTGSAALSLYYAATSSFRVRASYRESRAGSSNVGVGGITLQEAGFATWFLTRDSRTTATRTWSRLAYEGGIAINQTDSTTQANATSPGISVGGDVVMGGASISDSRRTTTRWNSRHLVRAGSARSWTAGIALAGSGEMRLQTPNPAGTFYFADVGAYRSSLAGGKTGTWSVTRGGKPIRFGTLTASPFAHTELVRARNVTLNGGLRADYQSGFGIIVSPRVSLSTEWRAFVLHAGAGMFVQSLPESIFISAMETDGRYLEQIAPEVSLRDPADGLLRSAAAVQSRIASGLTRPRTLMWRLSAERALHGVRTALEYSVADDHRLSGSERRLADSGWVDVFESNRSATRRRVHANARRTWDRRQLAIDYEYTFARDNTDGPFSFLEEPGNLAAEWAPSSGVPPHNFTVMTMLELPAAISVNMVDVWRSGAPFNITTALDSHGNGVVVDRGGRARNSGDGPRFHSLSLYVHRRVEWPDFLKVPQGSGVHLSVQVDNILNARNYFAVGSIAGSTTFGMPLAAYPGRSIRVMFSVD